jgi:signal transduction histidine kinase
VTQPLADPDQAKLEARFLALVGDERAIAYALVAPDLRVVRASKGFTHFLSTPVSPIEGQALSELIWEFAGMEAVLEELLRGDLGSFRLDRINRETASGETRYLDFQLVPLDCQNPGAGLLLVVQDATRACFLEQQLLQDRNELSIAQGRLAHANRELQRLSRLKSLFLAIAAHDLRSPLTSVRGYAEIVLSELSPDSPEEHGEFLLNICDLVERMDLLIADFLELDMIEQGKLSVHLIPCDLNETTREVVERMAVQARNEGLALSHSLSGEPNQVMADPERLRQILYNLIGNAIKFTPPGGKVEVVTSTDPEYGLVLVRDNGRGIPPEEFDYLFELYTRGQESQKGRARGAGLGLFIVKSFVDAQHGQIQVSSQPGHGTEFSVHLPKSPQQ